MRAKNKSIKVKYSNENAKELVIALASILHVKHKAAQEIYDNCDSIEFNFKRGEINDIKPTI